MGRHNQTEQIMSMRNYDEQESDPREEGYGDDFDVIDVEEDAIEDEEAEDGDVYDEPEANETIINDPIKPVTSETAFAPMPGTETPSGQIVQDERARREEFERLKGKQKMGLAIIAGLIVAVVCAALWALISVGIERQYGILAIGIGIAVGYTVRAAGKGVEPKFGVLSAILALLSCVLGNFLTQIGFWAQHLNKGVFEMLPLVDFGMIVDLMVNSFHVLDLLFYFLAISAAYGAGFKKFGEEKKKK